MTREIKCPRCGRLWLIEDYAPKWKGHKKDLRKLEYQRHRRWNRCYCGADLYGKQRKTITRN